MSKQDQFKAMAAKIGPAFAVGAIYPDITKPGGSMAPVGRMEAEVGPEIAAKCLAEANNEGWSHGWSLSETMEYYVTLMRIAKIERDRQAHQAREAEILRRSLAALEATRIELGIERTEELRRLEDLAGSRDAKSQKLATTFAAASPIPGLAQYIGAYMTHAKAQAAYEYSTGKSDWWPYGAAQRII